MATAQEIGQTMKRLLTILLFAIGALVATLMSPTTVESYEGEGVRLPENPTPQEYAFFVVSEKWSMGEYEYFYKIVEKESNWNHLAANPSSSARGLCQTMMSLYGDDVDDDFLTNTYKQVDWCIEYAEKTYGSPKLAWKEWQRKGWW